MTDVPEWAEKNVSRETLEDLRAFVDLLTLWNSSINLVSRRDIDSIWTRHIWDSVQIAQIAIKTGTWTDMGSGGGLPIIPVAIMNKKTPLPQTITAVESDARKCAFLRQAAVKLGLSIDVLNFRIEEADVQRQDVVSARALAPVSKLLEYAQPMLKQDSVCLFPKGQGWRDEVEEAQKNWQFTFEATPSYTGEKAAILTIKDVERV